MKFKVLIVIAAMAMSTLAITPAHAIGETLDQVSNSPGYANSGLSTQTVRYQSFTAGVAGPLARLDLPLSKQTDETIQPITVKLLSTDVSGEPNTTDVLAQTSIPASRIGKSKSWVRVIFATPFSLVSGTKYALALSTLQQPDENEDGQNAGFSWFGRDWNEPDYSGGASSTHVVSMDLWYRNQSDMGFRTYSGAYTQPATSVIYDLDGGTSALPVEDNQSEGDTFPVAGNPTKPGFVFNGWTDQSGALYGGFDYINSVYTMGQSNVVLKANWLPLSHPISRFVHNNGSGGDTHWNWVGGGLHEGTDVQPGWCVVAGPGSNPENWMVTGRQHAAQSETFFIKSPNQFEAAAYTFSPDPDISITAGSNQTVLPNHPIITTAVTNSGCSANKYTVEPALPAGLTLNENTGVISGTPAANQARTAYTVTAKRYLNEDDLSLDVNGVLIGLSSATFTLTVSNTVASSVKPLLSQYFTQNQASLSPFDLLKLKTVVSKLRAGSTVKLVAYVYGSGSAANRYSKSFASVLAKTIKTLKPSIRTTIDFKYCRKAPAAASGSKWIDNSIRVDLAK